MKLLKHSFALILIGTTVLLSVENIKANGSLENKSDAISLPRDGSPHQNPAAAKKGEPNTASQSAPSPNASISSPVNPPPTDTQQENTDQQPLNIWEKSFAPETWSQWGLLLAAIIAACIALRTLKPLGRQVEASRAAAEAAKESADAAFVASMPVLSPLIVGGTLHPFPTTPELLYPSDQAITFDSSVHFVFENFGKTPGMIREVRANLFLCEMDEFPVVNFEQLPLIDYQPIIAGDSRGEKALMGVAECTKRMILTPTEFSELLASSDKKYRRFAFIGRIIYDDFFGYRHIRRFCVKLRRMNTGIFQLVRGGRAYNHVERHQMPKDDQFS
jgi:hypothetical protein